jgi:hypothetical protein
MSHASLLRAAFILTRSLGVTYANDTSISAVSAPLRSSDFLSAAFYSRLREHAMTELRARVAQSGDATAVKPVTHPARRKCSTQSLALLDEKTSA